MTSSLRDLCNDVSCGVPYLSSGRASCPHLKPILHILFLNLALGHALARPTAERSMIGPVPLRILFKVGEEGVAFVESRLDDASDEDTIDQARLEALLVDFGAADEEDARVRVIASGRVESVIKRAMGRRCCGLLFRTAMRNVSATYGRLDGLCSQLNTLPSDHHVSSILERTELGWDTVPCLPTHNDDILMRLIGGARRHRREILHLFRQTPWQAAVDTDAMSFGCCDDDGH